MSAVVPPAESCAQPITDERLDELLAMDRIESPDIQSALVELRDLRAARNRIAGGTGAIYDLVRQLLSADNPAAILQASFAQTAANGIVGVLRELLEWVNVRMAMGSRAAGHQGTWAMVGAELRDRIVKLDAVRH